jgi:hypothetical protein
VLKEAVRRSFGVDNVKKNIIFTFASVLGVTTWLW